MATTKARGGKKAAAEVQRPVCGPDAPRRLSRVVEDLAYLALDADRKLGAARERLAEASGLRYDPVSQAIGPLRQMAEASARRRLFRELMEWAEAIRKADDAGRDLMVACFRRSLESAGSSAARDIREYSCLISTGISVAEAKEIGSAMSEARGVSTPILDRWFLADAGPAAMPEAVEAVSAICRGDASLRVSVYDVFRPAPAPAAE